MEYHFCWSEIKEVNRLSVELNRDNYESEIKHSEMPVLVDFWGPQCGPCLALMPSVERLENDYRDRIKVFKVDVTRNRMLCAKLRVMSVPTFIIYKGGAEQNRLVGEDITENDIRNAIDAILG